MRTVLGEIGKEHKRYYEFFDEKKADLMLWTMIASSLHQIASIPTLHGALRWEVQDQIGEIYNHEVEPAVRIENGKRSLERVLSKFESQDVSSDFYHAKMFLSVKPNGSPSHLQQECEDQRESVQSLVNGGNGYVAAFKLRHFFLRVLSHFNLPQDYRRGVIAMLEVTSGKPASEALPIFYAGYEDLLAGKKLRGPKKKGLFGRLFG